MRSRRRRLHDHRLRARVTDPGKCARSHAGRLASGASSMMRYRQAWPGLTLLFLGCDGGAVEVRHPTPENSPGIIPVSSQLKLGLAPTSTALALFAGDLEASLTETRRIGAREGSELEIFGFVQDIGVGPAGEVYALDSRFNQVRAFDSTGVLLDVFGGVGLGPDELASPQALAVSPDGRWLAVADRGLHIKIIENVDGSLRYHSSFFTEVVPHDICFLGESIFVHGIRRSDQTTLHEYSLAGEYRRSFGQAYSSTNWLVVDQLSKGPMACVPNSGVIVTAFWRLPLIRAYSRTGTLLWSTWVRDFTPQVITEKSVRGRPAVSFGGRRGYDAIASLFSGKNGAVFLQTVSLDSASVANRVVPKLAHTYVLDTTDGSGGHVGDLPMLSAASFPRFVGSVFDPFPQMIVWGASTATRPTDGSEPN